MLREQGFEKRPVCRRAARPPLATPVPYDHEADLALRERAAALCDLLADPGNGIRRVWVAGARPDLIAVLQRQSTARGLTATSVSAPPEGSRRICLQRANGQTRAFAGAR